MDECIYSLGNALIFSALDVNRDFDKLKYKTLIATSLVSPHITGYTDFPTYHSDF